jgi:hypothetical protein
MGPEAIKRFLCLFTTYLADGYPASSPEWSNLMKRSQLGNEFMYLVTEQAMCRWLEAMERPPPGVTDYALVVALGYAMLCLREDADDREQWAFYRAFCRFADGIVPIAPYVPPQSHHDSPCTHIDKRDIEAMLSSREVMTALRKYTTWETRKMLWGLVTIDLGLKESVCVPVLHDLASAVASVHTSSTPADGIITILEAVKFGPFDAKRVVASFLSAATTYHSLVTVWSTPEGDTPTGLRGSASWALLASTLRGTFPECTHDPGPLSTETQPLVLELIGLGDLPPNRGRRLGCLIRLLTQYLRLTSRDNEAILVQAARIGNAALQRAASQAMSGAMAVLIEPPTAPPHRRKYDSTSSELSSRSTCRRQKPSAGAPR